MAFGNNEIRYGVGFDVDMSSLEKAKKELENLKKSLTVDNFAKIHPEMDTSEVQKKVRELMTLTQQMSSAMSMSFNSALGTFNLNKMESSLKTMGTSLSQVRTSLVSAGADGTAAWNKMSSTLTSTNGQITKTTTLIDKAGTAFGNAFKYTVAYGAINKVAESLSNVVSYIEKLDTSLNKIQIVTQKSADSMAEFANNANTAAKNLGVATTSYTNAALTFYQQGLSDEEVQARTDLTTKVSNTSGLSADDAAEYVTSVLNGYKVGSEQAEAAMDILANTGAHTASSLSELAEGMSKVASSANTMGVSEEQLAATLATVISTTRQDASTVGTAFKTIYARINDIEAGTSEAETTLGNYTAEMAKMGINVLDSTNHLRDTGEVIEEIGEKWGDYTKEQQVALAQTMAGTRQYNNLMALFDNFDEYKEALGYATNAEGTLQQQQDTYMESASAHLKQMQASWEEVASTLLDPDVIKTFADAVSGVAEVFNTLIDSVGGLGNTLLGIGAIATKVFNKQIGASIAGVINKANQAKLEEQSLQSGKDNINSMKMVAASSTADALKEVQAKKTARTLTPEQAAYEEERLKANLEMENSLYDFDLKRLDIAKQLNEADQETLEKMRSGLQDQINLYNTLIEKAHTLESEAYTTPSKQSNMMSVVNASTKTNQAISLQNKIQTEGGINQGSLNQVNQVMEKVGKTAEEQANKIKAAFANTKTAPEGLISEFEKLTSIITKTGKINMGSVFGKLVSESKAAQNSVQELYNKFQDAEKTGDQSKIISSYEALEKEINRVTNAVEKLVVAAKDESANFGKNTNANLASGNQELLNQSQQFKSQADLIKQSFTTTTSSNTIFDAKDLESKAQMITNLSGNVMQLGFAISSVQNLGSIWSDEDLSTGEKILETVTNLGMAIPMVIPSITTLINGVKGLQTAAAAINTSNISSMGSVVSDIQQNITKVIGSSTSVIDKQSAAMISNTLAQKGLISAEEQSEVSEALLAAQRKKGTEALTKEEIATITNSYAKGEETAATVLATKAQEAFNKVMNSTGGLIFIMIAAIAAAIVALKALGAFDSFDTLAKEAEDASEAAKNLSDAYTKVKEKSDALSSAAEEYEGLIDTLNECTKGTDEWYDALSNVQDKQAEILQEYPELLKMSNLFNEDGTFNMDAIEEAVEEAQNTTDKFQAGSLYAQVKSDAADQRVTDKNTVQNAIQDSDLYNLLQKGGVTDPTAMMQNWINKELGGMDATELQTALKEKLESLDIDVSNVDFEDMASDLYNAINEISNGAESVATELLNQAKTVASTDLDLSKYSEEISGAVINYTSGEIVKKQQEYQDEFLQNWKEKSLSTAEDYFKSQGIEINGELELNQQTGEVTGKDTEGNDISASKTELSEIYAGEMVVENMPSFQTAAEKIADAVSQAIKQNSDSKAQDFVSAITKDEDGNVNYANVDSLLTEGVLDRVKNQGDNGQVLKKVAEALEIPVNILETILEEAGIGVQEFADGVRNSAEEVQNLTAWQQENLSVIDTSNMTMGEQKSYANSRENVEESASSFKSNEADFGILLGGIESENVDNTEGLMQFMEGLEAIDLGAPNAAQKIQELATQCDLTGQSVGNLSNYVADFEHTASGYESAIGEATSLDELTGLMSQVSEEGFSSEDNLEIYNSYATALQTIAEGYDNASEEASKYKEEVEQLNEKIKNGTATESDFQDANEAESDLNSAVRTGEAAEEAEDAFDLDTGDIDTDDLESAIDLFGELSESEDEAYSGLKNNQDAIEDAAVRYTRLNDGIEDLKDNYDEYEEALRNVQDATSDFDKASAKSDKTYKKLQKTLANILDTSEDLADVDGFADAIDPADLEAAAGGDEDAIGRIRDAFIDAQAAATEADTGIAIDAEQIKNELDQFSEGETITIDADNTPMLMKLLEAKIAAGADEEEIQSLLSGFNIDCDNVEFLHSMEEVEAASQDAANTVIQCADDMVAGGSVDAEVTSLTDSSTDYEKETGFSEDVQITSTTAPVKAYNGKKIENLGDISIPIVSKTVTETPMETENTKNTTVKGIKLKNAHTSAGGQVSSSNKSSGGSGGSGGGGGGGSSTKKATTRKVQKVTKQNNTADPYADENRALKRITAQYEKLADAQERLSGKELTNNLKQQIDLLKQQVVQYQKIQAAAKEQITKDKSAINKKLNKINTASGKSITAEYDSDGNLINGESIENKANKVAYDAENDANTYATKNKKAIKKGKKAKKVTWTKKSLKIYKSGKWKTLLIKNKKYYPYQINNALKEYAEWQRTQSDDLNEDVETLDSDVDTQEEAVANIRSSIDSALDLAEENYEIKIQAHVDLADAKEEFEDFKAEVEGYDIEIDGTKFHFDEDSAIGQMENAYNKINNYLGENGTLQALSDDNKKYTQWLADAEKNPTMSIEDYKEYIKNNPDAVAYLKQEVNDKGELTGYSWDTSALIDKQAESTQNYQEALKNLKEYEEQATEAYLQSIDDMIEGLNKVSEIYEQLGDFVEYDIEMLEKLNKTASEKNPYYDLKVSTDKKNLESLSNNIDEYYQKMNDTLKNGSQSEDFQKYYEAWVDAVDSFNEANEQLLDDLISQYENETNTIFDDFYKKITETVENIESLSTIELSVDLESSDNNVYLDEVNKQYALKNLRNKWQDSIDETTNIAAQEKLRDLMEEQLTALEKKNELTSLAGELSQAEIDRAEKQYELALKQIALEEAQQNKSKMRLRRDANGNYSYVFTADQDEVNKAQEEVDKAKNDLYNTDKENYEKNVQDIYSTYSDFKEKVSEIASEFGTDSDEYKAQLAILIEEYGEKLTGLAEQNEVFKKNFKESATEALNIPAEELDETLAGLSEYWNSAAQNLATSFSNALGDNKDGVKTKLTELQNSLISSNTNFSEGLETVNKNLEKTNTLVSGEEGVNSVYSDLTTTLNTMATSQEEYNKKLEAFNTKCETALTDIQNLDTSFKGVTESVSQSTDAVEEFAKTLKTAFLNETDRSVYITAQNTKASAQKALSELDESDPAYNQTKNALQKTIDISTATMTSLEEKNKSNSTTTISDNEQNESEDVFSTGVEQLEDAEQVHEEALEDQGNQPTLTPTVVEEPATKSAGTSASAAKKATYKSIKVKNVKAGNYIDIPKGDSWGVDGKWNSKKKDWDKTHKMDKHDKVKVIEVKTFKTDGQRRAEVKFGNQKYWKKVNNLSKAYIYGYDTGGYTGSWNDGSGKLALLHSKELVLNASDTENMLNAVKAMRGIVDSLGSSSFASVAASLSSLNSNSFNNLTLGNNGSDALEQNVHIEANFPNVTNSNEIQDAFNNLVNIASQRILRNQR